GHDGQQRGPVPVGLERHSRPRIDGQRQRGDPPGGHQAASLDPAGRAAALIPLARSENAIRAAQRPRPWQRPVSTYGVTVRFSNSTGSNGARVGGTRRPAGALLTTTSPGPPPHAPCRSTTPAG